MDSFEYDVNRGIYQINDEIIMKKMDSNKFQVYLIDRINKEFYTNEVIVDFELEEHHEVYLIEFILYQACSSDFTIVRFDDSDSLKEYIKVNILNEYSEDDFCSEPSHLKSVERYNKVMRFIGKNINDFLKLICILSIISLFNYFTNHKALFMLNSIYGQSMKPTLKTYSAGVVIYPYNINRGDLVACKKEIDDKKVNVLKRVIALPGDHVEIIDDYVYVNGTRINEPYIKNGYRTEHGETISWEDIWEYTTNQNEVLALNKVPATIPANYYFVLGDNRKDSYDSRDFGLVHIDEIVGEYIFTLLTL